MRISSRCEMLDIPGRDEPGPRDEPGEFFGICPSIKDIRDAWHRVRPAKMLFIDGVDETVARKRNSP